MKHPFYLLDHQLRCLIQDFQNLQPQQLSKRDFIQGLLMHTSVLAVSLYSAYVDWDASLKYTQSKHTMISGIHNEEALKNLGYYMGVCSFSINTLQAANIIWEEIEKIRRDITEDERVLLSTESILQRIQKNGSTFICMLLASASAIPLGYIMYKNSHSLVLTSLTFLTNAPISYRGVYNLRARLPINPLRAKKDKILIRSQYVFARHITQSYDNVLQKPYDVISTKLNETTIKNLYLSVKKFLRQRQYDL